MSKKSCLIIGGGICGLIAGNILKKNGFHLTIVDKGKGIGGRLATRSIKNSNYGEGVFDYGAQYFTVRDSRFQTWVNDWKINDIIEDWGLGFYDSTGQPRFTNNIRYRGVMSNRAIAKHLAKNLEIHTNQRIERIKQNNSGWLANSQNGDIFSGECLLLTPPIPQTLLLLKDSEISISDSIKTELDQVTYSCCITVLVLLKSDSKIFEPGGLYFDSGPIAWMADNHKKGISPNGFAVTIHAGTKYSEDNWDKEKEKIAQELFSYSKKWLGVEVAEYQVHRWRYSQVKQTFGEPFLHLKNNSNLFLAGDGFGGAKIEAAALSGIQVAENIIKNYHEG